MNNDFYTSEVFRDLMLAIQEKYGPITSYSICHSFESPEYLEYLAQVKEEGEEDDVPPEHEQLEVEYPDDEPDLEYEGEYNLVYLDGVIPVYERYYDPLYDDGEDEDWDEDYW